jgi:hypothetical protein
MIFFEFFAKSIVCVFHYFYFFLNNLFTLYRTIYEFFFYEKYSLRFSIKDIM